MNPSTTRHPLDLPRRIMRRAGVVLVLGVLAMAVLGLARMRDTVDDELAGARALAELSRRLSSLATQDDAQARATLARWQGQADLRHLHVRVADGQGRVLLEAPGPERWSAPVRWLADAGVRLFPLVPPFDVAWPLPRPDGTAWQVTLTASPDSERAEAITSILDSLAAMGVVSVLLLAVMDWNTRRAFRPLSALLSAIARLEHREPAARRAWPAMGTAELQTIASALQRLDQALEQAEQQRKRLSWQVLNLQEDERQRLARELHDEFGQRLTALRANAAWLQRRLAGQPEALEVLGDMTTHVEHLQQDMRAALARLRPPTPAEGAATLAELGDWLRALLADWQRSGGACRYALDLRRAGRGGAPDAPWPDAEGDGEGPGQDGPGAAYLPRAMLLALYRMSQEALTNVARHAQARQVTLALRWTPPVRPGGAGMLDWSVEDDGIGVPDPSTAFGRGNGLAGIQQRLWALGAELQAGPRDAGAPQPGWRLAARLRLDAPADENSAG